MDSRTQYDFIRKIGTAVLLFLQLVLCPSCDSDIPHPEGGNERVYTDVRLSVTTRADAGSTDVQTEEGMKTLRVIAASSSGEVFDMHYAENMENNRMEYNFTMKLPMGEPINFFAVANEMSVGADLSRYTKGSRLPENFYASTVESKNEGGTPTHFFPLFQKSILERGLPITGRITQTISSQNETITIPLTFAVAKVRITFDNQSGYAFNLTSIITGKFLPEQAFLFPQLPKGESDVAAYYDPNTGNYFLDDNYFVPERIMYFGVSGEDTGEFVDFQVQTGKETSLIFYVYESYNPDEQDKAGNYTLAFETTRSDNVLEEEKVFLSTPGIKRGTLLDITATITERASYSLYWKVKEWVRHEIDVPTFD